MKRPVMPTINRVRALCFKLLKFLNSRRSLSSFRSFRLRIALFSTILAGTALLGFSLLAWVQIYAAKVDRIDAALEEQVRRADRPRSIDEWVMHETFLAGTLEPNALPAVAFRITDAQKMAVYRSPLVTRDHALERQLETALHQSPPLPHFPKDRFGRGMPGAPLHRDRPTLIPVNPPLTTSSGTPARMHRFPPSFAANLKFETIATATDTWRVSALQYPHMGVAIALSLDGVNREMASIRDRWALLIPGVLLLVAGGAWGLSASALHPVHRLVHTIRQITAQGLDQRLTVGETDREFVELLDVFNQMLERLEHSFMQASRFSGDAAHELKTPLAILQGELERALQKADLGSETQQTFRYLLDEVSRLSGIVRKLLLLSLADAGRMNLQAVSIDVSVLLTEMLEDIDLLAPELTVYAEINPGLQVQGDRDLLTQIFQNLLSNAIKYNQPNGWIRIQARRQRTDVQVTFMNASDGIPAADDDRIFDRFHRGDAAHSRRIDGTGLGLSLSREIARAHGGELQLAPRTPGQTSFVLELPYRS